MRTARSVDDIIDHFGGRPETAKVFKTTRNAVGNWAMRDRIPAEYYLFAVKVLEPFNIKPSPKLFRMK